MNYTTIAQLKKDAKKARKNNNNIKNHSESLNLIAQEKTFKNWDDLINHAVILHDTKTDNNEIDLEYIIQLVLDKYNEFIQVMNSKNSKYISYFIQENFKNTENQRHSDVGLYYLDLILHLYCKHLTVNHINKVDLEFLTSLNNIDSLISCAIDIKREEEDHKTKALYIAITEANAETNFRHYLVDYFQFFNDINDLFINLFNDELDRDKVIDIISEPMNFSFFITSNYFNKDKVFDSFLNTLSQNPSLFDRTLRENLQKEIKKIR